MALRVTVVKRHAAPTKLQRIGLRRLILLLLFLMYLIEVYVQRLILNAWWIELTQFPDPTYPHGYVFQAYDTSFTAPP